MKGPALLGPTLAGIVISFTGTHGAFYANGISYLYVVGALLSMRTPAPLASQGHRFGNSTKAGLDYVYSQKAVLGVIFMEATTGIFGLDNAMLTIFASDVLRVGARGFGLLQSARGVGALIGSSLFIGIGQRPSQGKIILGSSIVYGICFALFGLSKAFSFSLVLISLVGAADAIWSAARSTILQWQTPDHLRGRVMGIFRIASQGLNPLGQVETGVVVPLIGAREATFFGGSIVWLMTLLTIWRIPQLAKFRIEELDPRNGTKLRL
jgi:hypothetical protein